MATVAAWEMSLGEVDHHVLTTLHTKPEGTAAKVRQSQATQARDGGLNLSASTLWVKLEGERVRVIELEEQLSRWKEVVDQLKAELSVSLSTLVSREEEVHSLRLEVGSLKTCQSAILYSQPPPHLDSSVPKNGYSPGSTVLTSVSTPAIALASLYDSVQGKDVLTVCLSSNASHSLGLEFDCLPSSGAGCKVIKAVQVESPALDVLLPGDVILEVNGVTCLGDQLSKAGELLREATGSIRLVVAREKGTAFNSLLCQSTPVRCLDNNKDVAPFKEMCAAGELKPAVEDFGRELCEAQERCGLLQEELQAVNTQLLNATMDYELVTGDHCELLNEFSYHTQEMEEIKSLVSEIKVALIGMQDVVGHEEEKLGFLEQQCALLSSKQQALEGDKRGLETQKLALESRAEFLTRRTEELKAEVTLLKAENDQLLSDVARRDRDHGELERRREAAGKERDLELAVQLDENEKLTAKLRHQEDAASDAKAMNQELHREKVELEEKLRTQQTSLSARDDSVRLLMKEKSALQEKTQSLEKELNSCKEQLKSMVSANDILTTELKVSRSNEASQAKASSRLQEEAKRLREARDGVMAENTRLKEACNVAEAQARASSATVTQLQGHLGGAVREKEALLLQLEDMAREREDHLQELEDVKKGHLQELEDVKKGHLQELEDVKKGHLQELEAVRKGHLQELEDVRKGHLQELEGARKGHLSLLHDACASQVGVPSKRERSLELTKSEVNQMAIDSLLPSLPHTPEMPRTNKSSLVGDLGTAEVSLQLMEGSGHHGVGSGHLEEVALLQTQLHELRQTVVLQSEAKDAELRVRSGEVEEALAKARALGAELGQTQATSRDLAGKLEATRAEAKRLEAELRDLSVERESHRVALSDKEAELCRAAEARAQLESQVSELRVRVEEQSEEMREHVAALTDQRELYSAALNDLEVEREKRTELVGSLRALQDDRDSLVVYEQLYRQSESGRKSLQEDLSQMEGELKSVQEKLVAVEGELRAENHTLRAQNSAMDKKIFLLNQRLQETESLKDAEGLQLREATQLLQLEIKTLQDDLKAWKHAAELNHANLRQLEAVLAIAKDGKESAQRDLEEARLTNVHLREELAKLQEELSLAQYTKDELSIVTEEYDLSTREVAELTGKYESSMREVAELTGKYESSMREVAELTGKLRDVKVTLATSQERQELRSAVDPLAAGVLEEPNRLTTSMESEEDNPSHLRSEGRAFATQCKVPTLTGTKVVSVHESGAGQDESIPRDLESAQQRCRDLEEELTLLKKVALQPGKAEGGATSRSRRYSMGQAADLQAKLEASQANLEVLKRLLEMEERKRKQSVREKEGLVAEREALEMNLGVAKRTLDEKERGMEALELELCRLATALAESGEHHKESQQRLAKEEQSHRETQRVLEEVMEAQRALRMSIVTQESQENHREMEILNLKARIVELERVSGQGNEHEAHSGSVVLVGEVGRRQDEAHSGSVVLVGEVGRRQDHMRDDEGRKPTDPQLADQDVGTSAQGQSGALADQLCDQDVRTSAQGQSGDQLGDQDVRTSAQGQSGDQLGDQDLRTSAQGQSGVLADQLGDQDVRTSAQGQSGDQLGDQDLRTSAQGQSGVLADQLGDQDVRTSAQGQSGDQLGDQDVKTSAQGQSGDQLGVQDVRTSAQGQSGDQLGVQDVRTSAQGQSGDQLGVQDVRTSAQGQSGDQLGDQDVRTSAQGQSGDQLGDQDVRTSAQGQSGVLADQLGVQDVRTSTQGQSGDQLGDQDVRTSAQGQSGVLADQFGDQDVRTSAQSDDQLGDQDVRTSTQGQSGDQLGDQDVKTSAQGQSGDQLGDQDVRTSAQGLSGVLAGQFGDQGARKSAQGRFKGADRPKKKQTHRSWLKAGHVPSSAANHFPSSTHVVVASPKANHVPFSTRLVVASPKAKHVPSITSVAASPEDQRTSEPELSSSHPHTSEPFTSHPHRRAHSEPAVEMSRRRYPTFFGI